ncbi:MAG: HNH endonuclease [Oxalobacteraceae bacterium]|nr:MAG: HNH endonuclease [Oxalobacteraceae bacterium]
MCHTLALNKDHLPIGVLPMSSLHWHDSIRAMYLNSVSVLEYYDNWIVHSPNTTIRVPAVVVSRDYVKIRRFIGFSPEMVHLRDGYKCGYCGGKFRSQDLTMDHVIPKSQGGKLTFDNIVSACGPCNGRRGNNTRIQPRHQPYRPTYYELVSKRQAFPITVPHASWIDHIGWDPRLVTIEQPVAMPGYRPTDDDGFSHDEVVRDILLHAQG